MGMASISGMQPKDLTWMMPAHPSLAKVIASPIVEFAVAPSAYFAYRLAIFSFFLP